MRSCVKHIAPYSSFLPTLDRNVFATLSKPATILNLWVDGVRHACFFIVLPIVNQFFYKGDFMLFRKGLFLLGSVFLLIAGIFLLLEPTFATANNGTTACVNGMAGVYTCDNVDLLSHLDLPEIGASNDTILGNDHWGWTSPTTGKDYVIFGLTDSTSFIDITDRQNPIYLGNLAGRDGISTWRDIKVYANHAYIASDIPTNGGLQVFDLTQLDNVVNPPIAFSETAHYNSFGPGHNLWINEDSGFLYVFRSDTCNGGIHMVDLNTPDTPAFAGCFAENDVPLSDAECLNYTGPDADYQGQEICFIGSDDNMSVGDVTDKDNPIMISQFGYTGIARAHQGSMTPDQRYWIMTDTMDEMTFGHNTRTYLYDMLDLDNPVYLGFYEHDNPARDHNAYIIGDIMYQTNWMSGLRVLNIGNIPSTDWELVGYFDIEPDSDSIVPNGAWSSYPWWSDGAVTVSGVSNGLFVLQPNLGQAPTDISISDFGGSNPSLIGLGLLLVGLLGIGLFIQRRQAVGRFRNFN